MMKLASNLYPYIPSGFQNLAISAYGLIWKYRRFGGVFNSSYHAFKEREHFAAMQWHDYQTVELRKLLLHAYDSVPYYSDHFKRLGFTRNVLERFEIEHLSRLPFLEKQTLRSEGTSRLLSTKMEYGGAWMSSSGTTGTPTKIRYSHTMHQKVFAAYESRVRNWAGVNKSLKRASIGGRRIIPQAHAREPYYRINYAEKQIYLSAYHISANTVQNYVAGIRSFGAQFMTGYTMSNYILARFIESAGLQAPEMQAVVVSSEKLTPDMRSTFKRVYGCNTYDGWSGVENCGLISENEYGQLLISPDVGIIEILDDDGNPVKPGETGHVICTGLLNYDQPLIRYKIGDRVTLAANQQTLCGRSMTIISDIEGRLEDIITGPDGRQMVRFHGIFVDLHSVTEAQLIQHTLYDYEIKVVCVGELSDTDKHIMIERMHSQLGNIRILFTEVPSIPRGANGKFKAVVSHITDGR